MTTKNYKNEKTGSTLNSYFGLCCCVLLTCFGYFTSAQVTVNPGGGSYATVSAAFTAINNGTHTGAVTVAIGSNTTEPAAPVVLAASGVGSANYTSVTIYPTASAVTVTSATSASRGVLEFNGADNIIINGNINNGAGTTRNLTIRNTIAVANNHSVLWFQGTATAPALGCTNIVIKNTILQGNGNSGGASGTTNYSSGVAFAGTTHPTSASLGANHQTITITNNQFKQVNTGIHIGNATATPVLGLQIDNNEIGSSIASEYVYYRGMFLSSVSGSIIRQNHIYNIRPSLTTQTLSRTGIEIAGTGSASITIDRNHIHGMGTYNTTTGYGGIGISLGGGSNHLVLNNLIYDIDGYGNSSQANAPQGIRLELGTGHKIYYNSVHLFGNLTGTGTRYSAAFVLAATSIIGIDVRNNIFSNRMVPTSGTAENMAMWFVAAYDFAASGNTINNNAYFVTPASANHFVGKVGVTVSAGNYQTLGAWQTVSGGDGQSLPAVNALAPFTSNTNLTIPPGSSTGCESAAVPIASLGLPNMDYTGINRPAGTGVAPDIGAYEFNGAACTAPPNAGSAINTPATPVCPSATVVLNLNSNSTGSGQTYQWFSDPSQFGSYGTAVSGINATSYFAINPATTLWYRCVVTCGANSQNSTPIEVVVTPGLSGTFTIDPLGSGPANFTTFTAAVAALSVCGASGPVVFNVAAGNTFNEQVTIPVILNASAINTVTFNGNGSTLQFASTNSTARHVLKLDGADYVTINNLIINASPGGGTYGWGVHLINQADHNTISNCTISTSTTDITSGNYFGIALTSSNTTTTLGNCANYTTIIGNTITGGYYTILFYGASSPNQVTNNAVINNIIRDSYGYTAYMVYQVNLLFRGNDVSRPTRGASLGAAGAIYTSSGGGGSLIEKNYVHDMYQNIPGGSTTMYGIYHGNDATAGAPDVVQNNVIYNLNNSNSTVYGLYNLTSPYVKYYHNSISLDDISATGTAATYGMYQTGTAAGIEYINNVVSVSRGGSGVKSCIFLNTVANTIVSNNNDLFMNSAGGNTGQWGANTFATIGDWQTANANAYDQASFGVNPGFVSPSTGNLKPTSSIIDNTGQNLGVATDILGVARGVNPDPGAYEFVPVTLDASIAWISPLPPVSGGLNTITVSVTNNQNTAITDLTLAYTDGVTPQSQTFSGLNITLGNTQQFSFTTQYNFGASSSSLKGYITSVNGLTDANQLNDTTATQVLCAALSGVYTINSGVATGGSNFQTFNSAVARLACGGVSGAVTFNVVGSTGPYTEQIAIPAIAGASAINTITFNGNGNMLTYSLTNASARHVIRLEGADYITINNLTIVATAGSYGWGIHFYNGADHNTISNCTINVGTSTAVAADYCAIVMSNSFTVPTTQGNNGNYNTITGNTLSGGYYTVVAYGNSTAGAQCLNNIFSNNILTDSYDNTIYAFYQKNIIISGNDISRPTRTSVGSPSGIYLGTGCLNSLIEKNKIHNCFGAILTNTGTSYGINVSADGTFAEPNRIVNNMIYDVQGNGAVYGIYNTGADYMQAYHNTISLDYAASTAGAAYGFYQVTVSTGIEFRNNIITISKGGSGIKYGLYFSSTGAIVNSNNNDIYLNSAGSGAQYIGNYVSATYTTLALWQGANGGVWDQQSRSYNPGYTNTSIGNFTPTNSLINDMGVNVGVATDILNTSRNATTPDAGAYEFTPVAIDGTIAWVSPVAAFTPGLNTITVSVTNVQAAAITSLDLTYTDGVTPVTQSFTGLNIAQSTTQQFSFTTQYNISGNAFLKAYITAVNGINDGNQLNDTTSLQEICVPLAGGTYTINSTLATGGSNFQSFSAAFGRLAYCGMTGPIVFNVTAGSGPYNEQLTIPVISGSSSINTITVNGNGRTIRVSSSVSAKHTIGINGADYIAFDNLIIQSLNATYGIGVFLTNGADHIQITNCTIDLSATTNTGIDNSAGIASSNSAADVNLQGNNASYLTATGNTIIGGYQGIILNGATGGINAVNNIVSNNIIRDFYSKGIELTNNNGAQINGNNINRATRVVVTSFYGIELGAGNSNVLINANRIHDTHTNASALTALAYGIYFNACDALSGSENRATNNVIYNFNSATGVAYGFYNAGSDGTYMYHNTIALNNTSSTDGNTYGLYQTTAATNIRFINNIVSITRGGIGIKNCLYFNTPTSSITSNNNDLFINALSGTNGVGYHNSINYLTLANWKTANGGIYDALSKSLSPGFVSPATGDFTPTQNQLNAVGANVGVTTDFNGNPRSAIPDLGAIEFTTIGLDASISWVAPLSPTLAAGLQTITVSLFNTQTTTITDIELAYTDGITTETETFPVNIAASSSQQLSFSNQYNLTASSALRAYIISVNTIIDNDQSNDTTAIQNLCLPMSGAYTINSALVTGGTNFQTFNAAVSKLICGGINGAVTFTVNNTSGPYNEQVIIPSIVGSSAINTITFNGNGRTLTYISTDANQRATLTFNDADYITVNNLVILAPGIATTEYGYGVQMINNADNNTINNCTITTTSAPATASSLSFAGVVINSGAVAVTTGNSQCDNNKITGCTITGGYYGIVMVANGTVNMINGNQVLNNTVREFYEYGMYLNGNNGALIEGNSVSRPTRSSVTTFRGIGLNGNNLNTLINKNRIFNPFGGAATSTAAGFGIYFNTCDAAAGNENIVSNNLIYNHIGSSGNHNAVLNVSSDYVKYYHNTIVLNDVSATCTACAARGFYVQQSSTPAPIIGLEFINNIIAISQGGTSPKQAVYFEGTGSNIPSFVSSNNNFYITSTGGTINDIGFINGGSYNTLPIWQGASGQDANSITINPFFVNAGAGNYRPQVIQADNLGAPVGVLTDITGAARSTTTPDIGAYEYTGTVNNFCTGTPVAGTASGSNNLCNNQSTTLTLAGNSSLVGISLQWKQSSVSGGPYSAVTGGSGATTSSYVTALLTSTTYYVCEVSCSGGTSAITNEVVVMVTAPAISNPVGGTRCGYGVVNLSANSSTGQMSWYDQLTGGNLLATGTTTYSPIVNTTTSFYASAIQPLIQTPVTTVLNGNVSGIIGGSTAPGGNMFDITAVNKITLNSFDIHLENDGALAPSDITVYYKAGTYVGFTTNAGAWTLLGSYPGLISAGIGVPTPLPLPINLTIPAGQTYAFYIIVTNLDVANPLRYSSGPTSPAVGTVAASDYNIQIKTGTAMFGPFASAVVSPVQRLWNGRVNYTYDCEGPRTAIVATVNPAPAVTFATNHSTLCAGQTATLTATTSNPGYTITWNPGNLTGSSINVNPLSNTTYNVIAADNSGGPFDQCAVIGNIQVNKSPGSPPVPLASGGGFICEGSDIGFSGDNLASGQTSGNTYAWYLPTGTLFSNQQSPVINNANASNNGTYTLNVINQFLCNEYTTIDATVNPSPILSVLSTQNVGCTGGSDGSITVGATTGAPNYDFTSDFINFVNDPAQGTITNLPTGSTTIYVSDANGCVSQISASLTAISTVPPSANVIVPFIGMPANVCSGTTATLSIPAVSNATMYIWDAPTGAYFNGSVLNVSPFTTSTPSVTVTYGNPSGSLYSTGVQAANGCGASIRKIQKTRGTVSVPAAVTGATTACASGSGTYSTGAIDGATSYLWTVTGDATVSGTGTTATVTFGPAWTGGTLCVSAQTTCYTSAAKCISISKNAAALGAISGTFTACPNTTLSYNVPVSSGAASYAWTVPTGATVSSGQGTNSVNVTFAPGYSAVGSICVSVTSVCGVTSALKCKTVAPGLPTVPASITGASSGLCGQTIAYSCPSQGGGTSYNWTSPGTINSGQGSTSISTTFASLTTGSVCVTASNSCGSSAARCVAVKGAPNAPGAITATPSSWCANTSGIEFNTTTSTLTGSYTLSWAYPGAAVATYVFGGGNSTSLILDWKTGSGNVNVTASNACGASTKTSTWSSTCREGSVSMVSSMTVSPNPTTGVININYTASKGSTVINVLDLAGRVVMTENTNSVEGVNNTQLDMSKLAKGAYMLSVQSTQGNKQVRVVVE